MTGRVPVAPAGSDAYGAGGAAGEGDPLLVDRGLGDLAGLDVVDRLAALLGAEVEEERRLRGRGREFRGSLLQHWRGRDVLGDGELLR